MTELETIREQRGKLLADMKQYLLDRRGELVKIIHRKNTLAKLDGHEIRTNTAKMVAIGNEGVRIDALILAIEAEESSYRSTSEAMRSVFIEAEPARTMEEV
jgi:hypothetical protein